MTEHEHHTLEEQVDAAERNPYVKKAGLLAAAVLALIFAAAMVYLGLVHNPAG